MTVTFHENLNEFQLAFIRRNEWGRLRPETLAYYENPDLPIAVFEKRGGENNRIIGIAVCAVDKENKKSHFNITVVSRFHRGKGIGTELLQCKLNFLERNGVPYETEVALDNGASIAICLKNNLKMTQIERNTRTAGKFNCAKMISKYEI